MLYRELVVFAAAWCVCVCRPSLTPGPASAPSAHFVPPTPSSSSSPAHRSRPSPPRQAQSKHRAGTSGSTLADIKGTTSFSTSWRPSANPSPHNPATHSLPTHRGAHQNIHSHSQTIQDVLKEIPASQRSPNSATQEVHQTVPTPQRRPTYSQINRNAFFFKPNSGKAASFTPTNEKRGVGEVVAIVRDMRSTPGPGEHHMEIVTGNGIRVMQQVVPGVSSGSVTRGAYQFTHPDGTVHEVTYVADENGFRPSSPMLPVSPTNPHLIPNLTPTQHTHTNPISTHPRTHPKLTHARTQPKLTHTRTHSTPTHPRTHPKLTHARTQPELTHARTHSTPTHPRTHPKLTHAGTESSNPSIYTLSLPHALTHSTTPHARTNANTPHARTRSHTIHSRTNTNTPHARTRSHTTHARTNTPHAPTSSNTPRAFTHSVLPQTPEQGGSKTRKRMVQEEVREKEREEEEERRQRERTVEARRPMERMEERRRQRETVVEEVKARENSMEEIQRARESIGEWRSVRENIGEEGNPRWNGMNAREENEKKEKEEVVEVRARENVREEGRAREWIVEGLRKQEEEEEEGLWRARKAHIRDGGKKRNPEEAQEQERTKNLWEEEEFKRMRADVEKARRLMREEKEDVEEEMVLGREGRMRELEIKKVRMNEEEKTRKDREREERRKRLKEARKERSRTIRRNEEERRAKEREQREKRLIEQRKEEERRIKEREEREKRLREERERIIRTNRREEEVRRQSKRREEEEIISKERHSRTMYQENQDGKTVKGRKGNGIKVINQGRNVREQEREGRLTTDSHDEDDRTKTEMDENEEHETYSPHYLMADHNPSLSLHNTEGNTELRRGFPRHSAEKNPSSAEDHPHLSVRLPHESKERLQINEGNPKFSDGNPKFSEWVTKFGEDNIDINHGGFQINEGPQFSEESSQSNEDSFQFNSEVNSKVNRMFSEGNFQVRDGSLTDEESRPQFSAGGIHSSEKSPQFIEKHSQSSQESPHQNDKENFRYIVDSPLYKENNYSMYDDEDELSPRLEEMSPFSEVPEGNIEVSRSEGLPSMMKILNSDEPQVFEVSSKEGSSRVQAFRSEVPRVIEVSRLEEPRELVSWIEIPTGVKVLKSEEPEVVEMSRSEGPRVEVSTSDEPGVGMMARTVVTPGVELSRSEGPGFQYSRVEYFSQPPDILATPRQDQQETIFYPVISKEQPHKLNYQGNEDPIEVPSPIIQAKEAVSVHSDVPVYIPVHLRDENGSISIVREIKENIENILSKSFQDSQVPEAQFPEVDGLEYDGLYTADDSSEEGSHQDEGLGIDRDSHNNNSHDFQEGVGETVTEGDILEVQQEDEKELVSSQFQDKEQNNSREFLERELSDSKLIQVKEEHQSRQTQNKEEYNSRQNQEMEDHNARDDLNQEGRLEEVEEQDLDQVEGRESPDVDETVILKEGRNNDQILDEGHVQRREISEYNKDQIDSSSESIKDPKESVSSQVNQKPTDTYIPVPNNHKHTQRETRGNRRLLTSPRPRTQGRSSQQAVREGHKNISSDTSGRGPVTFHGEAQRIQRGPNPGETEEKSPSRDQITTTAIRQQDNTSVQRGSQVLTETQYGLKYTQDSTKHNNSTGGLRSKGENTSKEVHKRDVGSRGVHERGIRTKGHMRTQQETSARKWMGNREMMRERRPNASKASLRRVVSERVVGERAVVGERRSSSSSSSSSSSRIIPRQATSALMAALTLVGPLHH
ncbi:hypothetical protein Pmani_003854 [Petrolisthes manimaculis]|uniref:Uncharacterized protein n=1 Tax=Petrolisthes manimaculis TaxID=1843537 RepID=A0AAE1QHR9_9EUCA|nr:hypothetical protein Pmani_003854 [Petrolisthes manimaculis]